MGFVGRVITRDRLGSMDTATEPLFPSEVAVTVAEPGPTPPTTPVAETVATVGWLVVQVTDRPSSRFPASSRVVAVGWCDSPTGSVSSTGETVTLATGDAASVPPPPHEALSSRPWPKIEMLRIRR